MLLIYRGMFDEVIVPEWVDERGYPQPPIKRGEPVEIDDALALRMLDQTDNWQKAPTKPGKQSGDSAE